MVRTALAVLCAIAGVADAHAQNMHYGMNAHDVSAPVADKM